VSAIPGAHHLQSLIAPPEIQVREIRIRPVAMEKRECMCRSARISIISDITIIQGKSKL
jgi:hypothetical protein